MHSNNTRAERSHGGPRTVLTRVPSLLPLLAAGALRSPFKRPSATADFPRTRLVLPRLRVDLARLAAYERVCGFPTGEDALPVTYPHVLGFPLAMSLMSGRDFPLPLLGLVHTSIEITRYRELTASGEYELTVHVDGLAPHRRGTEASVVTELRVGEDVVWESVSTYLARHRTTKAGGERARGRDQDRVRGRDQDRDGRGQDGDQDPAQGRDQGRDGQGQGRDQDPAQSRDQGRDRDPAQDRDQDRDGRGQGRDQDPAQGRGRGRGWDQEERGPLPGVAEWRLAGDVGRRYAAASGDRNPIHLYPLTARLFGFERAIAHGMWTAARCLAAHGTPQAVLVRAEFRAPVLLPGTVTYAADGERFELCDGERVHVTGGVYPLTGPGAPGALS